MTSQLFLLELNEVNFDHLRVYAERGDVPHLKRLIDTYGIAETVSEHTYERLEPWIQWVTAHTGLPYEDHRIFRLGDIVKYEIPQIWEHLEDHGLRVAAMSPMNAKNRTRKSSFFIPDPWTPTALTGGALLRRLYAAIAQAVNDNAQSRLALASVAWLIAGFAFYARPLNYGQYGMLAAAHRKPWCKAMLLDLLLTDVFIRETRRTTLHFASLFLNAAAHIQHHYMFNSLAYRGERRNPEWYILPDEDPVGAVYRLYDRIVGQVHRAFPKARIMIATGLRQHPHANVTCYWRLKDHAAFLKKIGVPFKGVQSRMSRDFVVECGSEAEAARAAGLLASVKAENGVPIFDVDNRGGDLFVMLAWPNDIASDFIYKVDGARFERFRDDVAFVAIKNGQHDGTGYFIDTGLRPSDLPDRFPLAELPHRVCDALGVRGALFSSKDPLSIAGSLRASANRSH